MKDTSKILLLVISLVLSICLLQKPISAEGSENVLLVIKERYGSADLQFMESNEAVLMNQILESAGFQVVIASASGRTFLWKEITLEPDLMLAEVNIADYAGFIITCSGLGPNISPDSKSAPAFREAFVKPEEVAIAKQISPMGKPVAAQHRGIIILAQAGALAGKQYSYDRDLLISEATYGGQGVIQAGNVITSNYCPSHADYVGQKDQTAELTQALITLIKK